MDIVTHPDPAVIDRFYLTVFARPSRFRRGTDFATLYGIMSIPFVLLTLLTTQSSPHPTPIPWGFIAMMQVYYVIFGFLS